MSMESTTRLLKKYENNNYVPGERRTPEQEKVHKQKQRLTEKHLIADELICDMTKFFMFNEYQKQHIHYLIDKFSDFRKLHGNCSKEEIILTFIFYVAKINDPRVKLTNYGTPSKYGLTDNKFELIICRIVQTLLAESSIVPVATTKYDHDVLYKTGQR